MAEYTQKDKLLALGIIERYSGVIGKAALQDIRTLLNAPELNKSTVHRWWQSRTKLQEKPATGTRPKKRKAFSATENDQLQTAQPLATPLSQDDVDKTLTSYFAETAMNYLKHANQEYVIAEMKGKDAVMAAAIAVDKMRLLLNLPTEIIEILPDVLAAIEKTGRNPYEVLGMIRDKFNVEYQH